MISLLPAIVLLLTSHIVVQGEHILPDLVQGVLGQKVGAPLLKYAKYTSIVIKLLGYPINMQQSYCFLGDIPTYVALFHPKYTFIYL